MLEDNKSINNDLINADASITINYVNFNQTGSCISVGTNKGLAIFNIDSLYSLSPRFTYMTLLL